MLSFVLSLFVNTNCCHLNKIRNLFHRFANNYFDFKAGKRMIKMMKNSIETKGNVESNEAIVQLDIIVELIDKLSPWYVRLLHL